MLQNDVKKEDLAASLLTKQIRAAIISKEDGVIAGLEEFSLFNKDLKLKFYKKDGDNIKNGEVIVEIISAYCVFILTASQSVDLPLAAGLMTLKNRGPPTVFVLVTDASITASAFSSSGIHFIALRQC